MIKVRAYLTCAILSIKALTPLEEVKYPNPLPITGHTFIHDPTMIKKPDGTYLAAFTADNIGLKTSKDRVNWTDIGPAFPNGTPWTSNYTHEYKTLWAPDLSYHNGRFYMYYAGSTFGSSRSGIFLATSDTAEPGSWINQGLVVESFPKSGYNAIDPNLFVDSDGTWWLSFGSFWSGLKLVELEPSTGKPINRNNLIPIAQRPAGRHEIEAPFITKRGTYYYLWVAFDLCCRGRASTYRTVVGRATAVTGPYVDRNGKSMMAGGGTEILATHDNIYGPGHPAVLNDNGTEILVYHYYNADGVAQLGMNLICYEDDWPVAY